MAMNEQDYNRYRQRVEQLATKQSDDPYRQRFEQVTANTPTSQNITPAYRGNERPQPTVGPNTPVSGGGASIDDDAWKYGRVDTRPQSISPEEQAWTNQMRPYQQTQAYPGRPYQRTPYQQALDDYDITSWPPMQSGYQGANSWPPMQSAPRQSYAPPQQSRFGGAPMPNRSQGQAQYTPLPDRNPGQARYTTLPDRNPGQAQMTPYSNSMQGGMNRKMNYRGR